MNPNDTVILHMRECPQLQYLSMIFLPGLFILLENFYSITFKGGF